MPLSLVIVAICAQNAPKSLVRTCRPPLPVSSTALVYGRPTRAAASRLSSLDRTLNTCGRLVISRLMARKSPDAASRPATITWMVPDSFSTSSRMWELKRMTRPSAPSFASRSIMCSRCLGSMPLNGSSSSRISGSWTSAAATLIRCRMPLE